MSDETEEEYAEPETLPAPPTPFGETDLGQCLGCASIIIAIGFIIVCIAIADHLYK